MSVWACRRLTNDDFYNWGCFRHTSTGLSVTMGLKLLSVWACRRLMKTFINFLCVQSSHFDRLSVTKLWSSHFEWAQCDKGFKTQCQSELVEDWRKLFLITYAFNRHTSTGLSVTKLWSSHFDRLSAKKDLKLNVSLSLSKTDENFS